MIPGVTDEKETCLLSVADTLTLRKKKTAAVLFLDLFRDMFIARNFMSVICLLKLFLDFIVFTLKENKTNNMHQNTFENTAIKIS